MVLLIVENWILREVTQDEQKEELKKQNWNYRLVSKNETYTLIDYDKDQARFYVKALLAKVNKLKEVKMLWGAIFLMTITFLSMILFFTVTFFKFSEVIKAIDKTPSQTSQILPPLVPTLPPLRTYDDTKEEINTWTNINAPIKKDPISTNHLFK